MDYMKKTVTEIRQKNPQRIIFISPVLRSAPENLKDLKIPTQHNNFLMAEWHFYASGPDKTNENKKWTTGTEAEKELIRNKIKIAKEWSTRTGILTWVDAWMPGNPTIKEMNTRLQNKLYLPTL
ncbi:MAG: cellulase family glycosylhydrolase [Emticicia sp.]|nr:cellulase family glycosylhydrolase [Emticicia sp.]